MSRARLFDTVLYDTGRPIVGASVSVYQPGTVTPISETLYADDTGGTTVANPLMTAANGSYLAYLDVPRRVDLYISAVGQTPWTVPDVGLFPDPADFATDTDIGNHVGAADPHTGYVLDATLSLYLPKSLVDAKGDLLAGTAADTVARLAAGTDGFILESRASESTGLKWISPTAASSPLTTRGDMPYRNATVDTRLAIGAVGTVLKPTDIGGGVIEPRYGTVATADIATGGQIVERQLDYTASTDINSGTALTINTWTDLGTNQTFTVDDANSLVEIVVRGSILAGTVAASFGSRLNVDSAGTPITRLLGGANTVAGAYGNPLAGSGSVFLTGLAAGSHTVKVQLISASSGDTFFCRASTAPNTEHLAIQVVEYKR